MDHTQAIKALKATGVQLERAGRQDRATVILGGAVAAMASAMLPDTRITQDCDVLASELENQWQAIRQAAGEVAKRHGLRLNQDARMYVHWLPLG